MKIKFNAHYLSKLFPGTKYYHWKKFLDDPLIQDGFIQLLKLEYEAYTFKPKNKPQILKKDRGFLKMLQRTKDIRKFYTDNNLIPYV
jgi:hypothetical protein